MKTLLQKTKQKVMNALRILGPGFTTGSADDDPSGIGTYSLAGAKFGLLMAWLVPFQLPLMFAIQEMCARIGLATGKGLAANMKLFLPKTLLYLAVALLVIANTINIGADIAIMAASVNLVVGHSIHLWAIVLTLGIIVLEIFVPYHFYSRILLILGSFLLAYAITALITVDNWWEVLRYTFTPHMQWTKEFILIAAGFIGTTISPYLFFWQASQEIEEKLDHHSKKEVRKIIKKMPLDTFIGMFFSQLMALFIVLTCYASLHRNGITDIESAYDAALALKPLAGNFASIIFSLGVIGIGLLGIPVLAGSSAYAISEIWEKKESLAYTFNQARFFYGVIAISTLVGLGINFIGIDPINALLYAAVINCIVAAPLVAFILVLANKKKIMHDQTNGFLSNLGGIITLIVLTLSSIFVIVWL